MQEGIVPVFPAAAKLIKTPKKVKQSQFEDFLVSAVTKDNFSKAELHRKKYLFDQNDILMRQNLYEVVFAISANKCKFKNIFSHCAWRPKILSRGCNS